jgi:hypothetical protein
MLEAILAFGNFLNSGTGRGGAHGFKIEALAMLNNVKDVKGDTLLDYIVRYHQREKPGVLPLDDMPNLSKSNDISLEAIGEEVNVLIESVSNVAAQIAAIGDDASLASFKAQMESFSIEAVQVRDEIVSLRALMMEKLQLMMAHFGERNKVAQGRQEDVLRMLREFSAEVDAVLKKDAEKEERDAKKKSKVGVGAAKGGAKARIKVLAPGAGEAPLPPRATVAPEDEAPPPMSPKEEMMNVTAKPVPVMNGTIGEAPPRNDVSDI